MGKKTEPINEITAKLNIEAFKERSQAALKYLRHLEKIRIFFDANARNFGHGANSIYLLHRMIDLGLQGPFEIVLYGDADSINITLGKIPLLLPQFQQVDQPFKLYSPYGVAVYVTIIRLLKSGEPLPKSEFAITGSFQFEPIRQDILDALNVDIFVTFQPYGWTIDRLYGSYYRKKILDPFSGSFKFNAFWMDFFRTRATIISDSYELSQSDRDAIYNREEYKWTLLTVEWVVELAKRGESQLGTAYGLHNAVAPWSNQLIGEYILYNYCAGILDYRRISEINIPAIVLVFAKDGKWLSDFNNLINGNFPEKVNPSPLFLAFHGVNHVKDRIKTAATPQDAPAAFLTVPQNGILVVAAGPAPYPLFNYAYTYATLPPIFEGQGTLELMLNLGQSYLKMANRDGVVHYPALPVEAQAGGAEASKTLELASKNLFVRPEVWNKDQYPPSGLLPFFQARTGNTSFTQYFRDWRLFSKTPENDKFMQGMSWTLSKPPKKKEEQQLDQAPAESTELAEFAESDGPTRPDGPPESLDQLYTSLSDNLDGGEIDMLVAVDLRLFDAFFRPLTGDTFIVTDAKLTENEEGTLIMLEGKTDAFHIGNNTPVVFTFDQPDLFIVTRMVATDFLPVWTALGAQWISIDRVGMTVVLDQEAPMPVSTVVRTIVTAGVTIELELHLPTDSDVHLLQARLVDKLVIKDIFQMVGGINLEALLPPQIQAFASIGVDQLEMRYNTKQQSLSYIGINLSTATGNAWDLVSGVQITGLQFMASIIEPGNLAARQTSYQMSGQFKVGDGIVEISALLPGLLVWGQLAEDSPPINLNTVIKQYLGDHQLPPADIGIPLIAGLSFSCSQPQGVYSFGCMLIVDWVVKIADVRLFIIKQLSFNIQAISRTIDPATSLGNAEPTEITGSFSGLTEIAPDTDSAIELLVKATYLGQAAGWTFSSTQTSGIVQLYDLLGYYLGNTWKPNSNSGNNTNYGINGLIATISPNTSSYTFTGKTATPWAVPFLPNTTLAAQMRLGYNGINAGSVPAGPFAELNFNILWNNIALDIFFNYNPSVQSYGFIWGRLNGKVTKQNNEWVGTLSYSGTIGDIISSMISWATGSSFGLSAPWNVLNNISISNVALLYNFTTNKVSFQVNIGPVKLSFATIDKIVVDYKSGQQNPDDNGVKVELRGSFLWQSNPQTPVKWDAAQPQKTPTPPGQGNEYLDLRLLALGQHVTSDGISSATTVQLAIERMSNLPPTKTGEIPNVQFNPQSKWMVGSDLRFLRDTAGNYALTLQAVFNDPALYGLRIALAGEQASAFNGLDFQIMYRQINNSLGVYQSKITLPTSMRRLSIGAYTVTLPSFAIDVFTNGDFKVDAGFPWNQDFSKSFTLEAIIPPAVPVLGSGGFYFGKLSSATSNMVPAATNGTFNPVFVFGIGTRMGLGKSVKVGLFSGAFELTALGIVEGVLAKWNPYGSSKSKSTQLQDQYYFWLQGTLGLTGRLYGDVDFTVVKAAVNVGINLRVSATVKAYAAINLSATASVNIAITVKIKKGPFKVEVSFSFSAKVNADFTLVNPGGLSAPWMEGPRSTALLARDRRQTRSLTARRELLELPPLNWNNLAPAQTPAPLTAYLLPALTGAGAGGQSLAEQEAVYVAIPFIQAPPPITSQRIPATSDSSFDILCKQVLRWVIAATQDSGSLTADQVDGLVINRVRLDELLEFYLNSTDSQPTPIPLQSLETFLQEQFAMTISTPDQNADQNAEVNGTVFPMPPLLELNLPAYGDKYPGTSYKFAEYNSLSANYLQDLRTYFNQLSVSAKRPGENVAATSATTQPTGTPLSLADFVFTDYFLLLARQMVQALADGLRAYTYVIQQGQSSDQVVEWVNTTGQLDPAEAYTLGRLFDDNQEHLLTVGKSLLICGAHYRVQNGNSFDSIAAQPVYGAGFSGNALASQSDNATSTVLLRPGAIIAYGQTQVEVHPQDSLDSLAAQLEITLEQFLADSDALINENLLISAAMLVVPDFSFRVEAGMNLNAVAIRFGITLDDLAGEGEISTGGTANGAVVDLFDPSDQAELAFADLVQFQVGALIDEAQRVGAIQQLAGMTSRFYLQGLRLPTAGITPNAMGMWVTDKDGTLTLPPFAGLYALTGQQFSLPQISEQDFAFTFSRPVSLTWLNFAPNPDQLTVTVAAASADALAIERVRAFVTTQALDTGLTYLGVGSMTSRAPTSYALNTSLIWQSALPVDLPYGTQPLVVPTYSLWLLPDTLANLPDPRRAFNPRFLPKVGRVDGPSGTLVTEEIDYYGWATIIEFTIQTVPAVLGSPNTKTSYEVVGADGNAIPLLERLLSQVAQLQDQDIFAEVLLGYAPDQSGDAPRGFQTDDPSLVSFGISQVNLSTVTRPPEQGNQALLTYDAGTSSSALLLLFVRLLWEASITRSGGFYLSYVNTSTGAGLPERIFNDRGQATLSLMLLYKQPQDSFAQNRVSNFTNALVTSQANDGQRSTIFVEADPEPVQYTPLASDSLASIAYRYYADLTDLATDNSDYPLAVGQTVVVNAGVYEVGVAAPGGDLNTIAAWFGTTVDAIKAANPAITDWPALLPLFTVLYLPELQVVIGTSPGGNTLSALAQYYGQSVASLAQRNSGQTGLLDTTGSLLVRGGPVARLGSVEPGVALFAAARPMPAVVPDDLASPGYAESLLLNNYSLLNSQVAANPYFVASNLGLPVGPTTLEHNPDPTRKRSTPHAMSQGDAWEYQLSMPYPFLAINTDQSLPDGLTLPDSPYLGMGDLLQVDFTWQDLYGNTLITDLTLPTATSTGPLNQPPLMTVYTDLLMGPSTWPSVSSSWTVEPGTAGVDARLRLHFSFDAQQYQQTALVAPHKRAHLDQLVYARILQQLADPNGIGYRVLTSLLPNTDLSFTQEQEALLVGWLCSIYRFLGDLAVGNPPEHQPDAVISIDNIFNLQDMESNQVFELRCSFQIARLGGIVYGPLASTDGIRETTLVVPAAIEELENGNGETLGLEEFATQFEEALTVPGHYSLKVASGPDRTRVAAQRAAAPLWAVRLGHQAEEGIFYAITNASQPVILAPRPIANTLQSRNQVAIHDYQTGIGIDFQAQPNRSLDFSEIDLDDWGRKISAAFDDVLTPNYTTSLMALGKRMNQPYLKDILARKEAFATLLATLMTPVFEDQVGVDTTRARQAFYQQLLVKLSALYDTRAAIEFAADVSASIAQGAEFSAVPRLFGRVVEDKEFDSQVSMTTPKLELQTSHQPLTFLLSSSEETQSSAIDLNLSYRGQAIEHQIGGIAGIEGYQASSWLSFVNPERQLLHQRLGDFQLPLLARSYPLGPTMTAQAGEASVPGSNQLDQLTFWDYSFTYSLPRHDAQDRMLCEVVFNLAPSQADERVAGAGHDVFPAMAEFVTVYPSVYRDLDKFLARVTATTTDEDTLKNAAVAVESFIKLVDQLLTEARLGLAVAAEPILPSGDGMLRYAFSIQQGAVLMDGVDALLVTVVGNPPPGIGDPQVLIEPELYEMKPYAGGNPGEYRYWYQNRLTQQPLTAKVGQYLAERRIVLPRMDILARQDAWASARIERNQGLVQGKVTAEPFVYRTPIATYANPMLPLIEASQALDIALAGSSDDQPVTRSLNEHLTALFDQLFKYNTQSQVTIQVSVNYGYRINPVLKPIVLPIIMQPPLTVDLQSDGLSKMIASWSHSIRLWFGAYQPDDTDGMLHFDLTLISNHTAAPMPLLRIRELYLALTYIVPPLTIDDLHDIDGLSTNSVIQFDSTEVVDANGVPTNTKDVNKENGFEIFFEKEFTTIPTVVVTPYWPNNTVPNVETIIKISEKSFVVRSWNAGPGEGRPYSINWVAIADRAEFVSTFFTAPQHGTAKMAKQKTEITIPFPQPFANPPTVVVSPYYQNKDNKPLPGGLRIIVTDVSTSGFTISASVGINVDYDVCWIARAKPIDTHFIATQHGTAKMAKQKTEITIPFPQPFANSPTVVVSQYYQGYDKDKTPLPPILTVTNVSTSEFTISIRPDATVDYDYDVCWIACAEPGDTNLGVDV